MNNNNNILFYSKKCEYSSKIINLISEIDSVDKYKFICIDSGNNYPYIQRVPTLIIKDLKKPLIGINAFNWIRSSSQFNRTTNNIKFKPNKFNNPNDNPLLYDISSGPNGMNNNNQNFNNFLFLKNNVKNLDNISYLENKSDDIYTLPEGSKINKLIQNKKLNALLNYRAQQDFSIFGSDLDLKDSSDKNKININDNSNQLNNRINKINFSTEPQLNLQNISQKDHKGINTSRILINKNSLKEN